MSPLAFPSAGRAEWLAARALLATRRLRPLLIPAIGIAALVLLVAGWWLRTESGRAEPPAARRPAPAEVDTVALRAAQATAQAELRRLDTAAPMSGTGSVPTDTSWRSAAGRQERDSLLAMLGELETALDLAAKSPLTTSYRTLASTAALRSLGAVSVLVDTLVLLEDVRRSLDPVAAPQREFAQLSERTHAIGASLQAIGQARRVTLSRRLTLLAKTSGIPTSSDSMRWQAVRDSLRARLSQLDSLLRVAARQDADGGAPSSKAPDHSRANAAFLTPVLGAVLLASVAAFTLVLLLEARRPTIAHAREAERVTGLPVLATIRESHIPAEGRARLKSGGGADPFRMVYLSLTVGEPRIRMVCVTGERPALVAAAAGQLAVHAAAEERSTLVVDLVPGGFTTAQYFGWKDEPGFTEAIAGVRLWREVATPIGASEGTDIELVAAGALRADTTEAVSTEANRREFLAFLGEHDFTVLTALTPASAILGARVADRPNTVLIAETARTQVDRMKKLIDELGAAGVNLSGIVMIDKK